MRWIQRLAVALVLVGCADLNRAADDALRARGYVNIQLNGTDGTYSWTADRASDGFGCEGGITVNVSSVPFVGRETVSVSETCAAKPGRWSQSLPQGAKTTAQKTALRCDQQKADACSDLGYLFEHGESGIDANAEQAYALYRHACDLGSGLGCVNAAMALKTGKGASKDVAKAVQISQQACAQSYAQACRLLGNDYFEGSGVSVNKAEAYEAFEKGCSFGDGWSCGNAALMLSSGDGVEADQRAAIEMAEKGCAQKSDEACTILAGFLGRKPNTVGRAKRLFEAACANGYSDACKRRKQMAP